MNKSVFKIAIIGRPNVGKSTLFNMLISRQIAIVEPIAGVTRDRKESNASLFDLKLKIIDTGGYSAVDEKDATNMLNDKIWNQSKRSVDDADCVLFVVDSKDGVTPDDKYLADFLRKFNKPIIMCINKVDTREGRNNLSLFYELGFTNMIPISATHRLGLNDLYDALKIYYFEGTDEGEEIKPELMLAVVGKPNVGKSTLINKLLHEDRLITSSIAGTTRDSIYIDLFYGDKKIKLVDTAGLRRRSKVENTLEKAANSDSIQAINFATVVALVISAEEGLTKQDLTLLKHVVEEGRGLLIVINKIDLIKQKQKFINDIVSKIENAFYQIKKPYIVTVSALKDSSINAIIDEALELYDKWKIKVPTSLLNKWLEKVIAKNPPPSLKGRRIKVKYASQIKVRPATINLWSNIAQEDFPESYIRYVQNEFYKDFNLWGSTVRFNIKKSDNPFARTAFSNNRATTNTDKPKKYTNVKKITTGKNNKASVKSANRTTKSNRVKDNNIISDSKSITKEASTVVAKTSNRVVSLEKNISKKPNAAKIFTRSTNNKYTKLRK